jgi:hypothetical protein
MPVLSIPIAAIVLSLAAGAPAAAGECDFGSISPYAFERESLVRDRACWDSSRRVWFRNIRLEVSRDSTVWIMFGATNTASLILARADGTVLEKVDANTDGARMVGSGMEKTLSRGSYIMQVSSPHAGTRYEIRPYWGYWESTAIAGCNKLVGGTMTTERDTVVSVELLGGCYDRDGNPGVVRRFKLSQAADVTIQARSRSGGATSIAMARSNLEANQYESASSGAGAPARLTRHLPAGTYFVMFSAEGQQSAIDVSVRSTETVNASALRDRRPAWCTEPATAPALAPNAAISGSVTTIGSCPLPVNGDRPQHYAEMYRLSVPEPRRVEFLVESPSMVPVVVIYRLPDGTFVGSGSDSTRARRAEIAAPLPAGDYLIGVTHADATEMGSFRLTVK